MPKQVLKIDQFHGGLNSNSSERDITDTECASASDVMFDEIGKCRMMGGSATHGEMGSTIVGDVAAGYGLFRYSHDREYAELSLTQHITNPSNFTSGSKWAGGNGWTLSTTQAIYSHHVSPADLVQTAGNRAHAGIGNHKYVLEYTLVDVTGAQYLEVSIAGGSGQFASAAVSLSITNGSFQKVFTSHADAASNPFTIDVASDGSSVFKFTKIKLYAVDNAETEDDYMVVADVDATSSLSLYSRGRDATSVAYINYGDQANNKPIFYTADGVLRVCDTSFQNTDNKWFGYIKDDLFQSCGGSSFVKRRFYDVSQRISKPTVSYFDTTIQDIGQSYDLTNAGRYTFLDSGDAAVGDDRWTHEDAIYDGDDGGSGQTISNIGRADVTIQIVSNGSTSDYFTYDIAAGPSTVSEFNNALVKTHSASGNVNIQGGGTYVKTHSLFWSTVTSEEDIPISNDDTTNGFRVLMQSTGGAQITDTDITSVVVYEGIYGGAGSHTYLTNNNVVVEIVPSAPSAGTAEDWDYEWEAGISFVYDSLGHDRQEGLIRKLVDEDSHGTETFTISDATYSPTIKLNLKYTDSWNPRIVGINLYMKRISKTAEEPWYLQIRYDLIQGKGKVAPSGNEVDFSFHPSIEEHSCLIENEDMLVPNLGDTFESESRVLSDEKSLFSFYKTAVIANRRCYIGNIKVSYDDLDVSTTEVMGDTILKSPVNKFDVFPLSHKIEAAVRDGDSIVAITEYADRLLEFKKRVLYVINISQDIEFLESTHMHKGVLHQSAVTKTDYGVAWVNRQGCYFYDGKQVTDLIEKGPRRVIKTSDWNSFTTDNSTIGYIPAERQLLVLKDCTATSVGDIFIYDMVTQSWSKGNSKITDSVKNTNFQTDWNGDLVWASEITSDTITVKKWSNDGQSSADFLYTTKDIDFGSPGVRKKVYKVYVTYKGVSATNIAVDYDVDGGTTFPYDFADGTNFTSTILAGSSSWAIAELKPDTSSESNNIKSFQLRFQASGTGPEVTSVKCVADVSDSLNGKYFDIYGAGGKTEVWIDTDNSGTSAPVGSGSYAQTIEVTEIETNDTDDAVAIAVASAIDDHANFSCEVQGSLIYITDAASAVRTDASAGDSGFTVNVEKQGGTSSVPSTFEINDISIIYRTKGVK